MDDSTQPLLTPKSKEQRHDINTNYPLPNQPPSNTAIFTAAALDMEPITSPRDFFTQYIVESKKLWYLAGPAIFSFVSKYSLGAVTQIFAGHVSTIDLAAVSVENSLIAGFSFGLMLSTTTIKISIK
ncbi:hypothetical protein TSUD_238410 [Trifolium subterraneum]|uniref:Protein DETOXIFICATION n=1 Tax=Trifolium subterraneum TaxID=3900 RepID=A0A2Z6PIW7_TRISU|nr:hypothetical protein TSUD_238410 [Trifolium subterraneum]